VFFAFGGLKFPNRQGFAMSCLDGFGIEMYSTKEFVDWKELLIEPLWNVVEWIKKR
jgi:hypothetical protein